MNIPKIIGFTGTSEGLTEKQEDALSVELNLLLPVSEAHHGDCLGADATFDRMCRELGIWRIARPGHTQRGESPKRAYCNSQEKHDPLPYMVRNKIIAEIADVLLACPETMKEHVRSGTWMTVRHARKFRVPVILVLPDGSVTK